MHLVSQRRGGVVGSLRVADTLLDEWTSQIVYEVNASRGSRVNLG